MSDDASVSENDEIVTLFMSRVSTTEAVCMKQSDALFYLNRECPTNAYTDRNMHMCRCAHIHARCW